MNPRAPPVDVLSLARLAGTAQACDTEDPIEPAVERHDPGNPAALHHGQVERIPGGHGARDHDGRRTADVLELDRGGTAMTRKNPNEPGNAVAGLRARTDRTLIRSTAPGPSAARRSSLPTVTSGLEVEDEAKCSVQPTEGFRTEAAHARAEE